MTQGSRPPKKGKGNEAVIELLAAALGIATDSGTDLSADSDDPTRRLIRQVLGAVDEGDRQWDPGERVGPGTHFEGWKCIQAASRTLTG